VCRTYVRPTVFLFPLGTGNALFHSLNRPVASADPSIEPVSDVTTALRVLLHGTPKPLPIFRVKFSPGARILSNEARDANPIPGNALYGAIVASYGLHATLVADSDTTEWRKHGDKRFGMVAKELLAPSDGGPPHAYKARIFLKKQGNGTDGVLDKEIEREEHGYVLMTLVSNLEKTFTISPSSEPLDGKLRIVHFGPESGEEVGRIMGLAYQNGKHVDEGKVGYEEVEGMRVELLEPGEEGTWRRVCVDGTIIRVEEGGWVEVEIVGETDLAVDVGCH
jgi:diacylglycerol kinase family enzyme